MTGAKVLVVEDEFIVATNLSETLSRLGYDVVGTAPTRADALTAAARTPPDLVLMDIQLKGERLGGVEAARELRSRFGIPVIFLTAHSDGETLDEAKRTEPYGYLLKPVDDRELRTAIEVSLHKHAMERRVIDQKEWLATVLRSIGDAVIATDREGRVELLNPVAEALTGWTQAEAAGRRLPEVFHIISEETRERCADPVQKVLETGGIVGLANHTALIARDGTERAIADSGAPIRGADGTIIGAVLVFRDVTDERLLEEERNRAQRLSSVAVLAGGVAHDFNNLLMAILGQASLGRLQATRGTGDPGERFEEIERACQQARGLTQQLLTFTRAGEPVCESARIGRVLQETAEFVLRGSSSSLVLDLAEDLWSARVDTTQIGQVVTNLVLNAEASMPKGGEVRIRAWNLDLDQPGPGLPAGRYVSFAVEDDGVGIAPGHLQSVFEPYFTTKSRGRGLGLASAYSIVTRHDGHIGIASALGKGTTVTVSLPADPGAPQVDADTAGTSAPEPRALRVLIMDDEPGVRSSMGSLLEELGHEVELVAEGGAAVAAFEANHTAGAPFDLVILDLTVPGGVGGEAALKRLRSLDPGVRAIATSGYSTAPVMSDFQAHGFVGALRKPFRLEELIRCLEESMRDA